MALGVAPSPNPDERVVVDEPPPVDALERLRGRRLERAGPPVDREARALYAGDEPGERAEEDVGEDHRRLLRRVGLEQGGEGLSAALEVVAVPVREAGGDVDLDAVGLAAGQEEAAAGPTGPVVARDALGVGAEQLDRGREVLRHPGTDGGGGAGGGPDHPLQRPLVLELLRLDLDLELAALGRLSRQVVDPVPVLGRDLPVDRGGEVGDGRQLLVVARLADEEEAAVLGPVGPARRGARSGDLEGRDGAAGDAVADRGGGDAGRVRVAEVGEGLLDRPLPVGLGAAALVPLRPHEPRHAEEPVELGAVLGVEREARDEGEVRPAVVAVVSRGVAAEERGDLGPVVGPSCDVQDVEIGEDHRGGGRTCGAGHLGCLAGALVVDRDRRGVGVDVEGRVVGEEAEAGEVLRTGVEVVDRDAQGTRGLGVRDVVLLVVRRGRGDGDENLEARLERAARRLEDGHDGRVGGEPPPRGLGVLEVVEVEAHDAGGLEERVVVPDLEAPRERDAGQLLLSTIPGVGVLERTDLVDPVADAAVADPRERVADRDLVAGLVGGRLREDGDDGVEGAHAVPPHSARWAASIAACWASAASDSSRISTARSPRRYPNVTRRL